MKAKEKNKNIKFGCYIYQDSLEYKDILRITLECEKLGYDSVWLKDNFIPWIQDYNSFNSNTDDNNTITNSNNNSEPNRQEKQHYKEEPTERMMLECWTTLSSLVSVTAKIRLGAILVNLYRNPAIVAKMASTLDIISNGRLDIGLSAGWYEREAHAYGVAFPAGSVRVEMLEESVIILRQMLNAENENETELRSRNMNISYKGIRKDSKLVIVGTPKTILREIKRYLNIGVTYFTVSFPDLPDTRSLQLFAEHVIPCFRNI